MARVTSGEFQKNFGTYKRLSFEEPVHISIHGQPSLVLMSSRHYEELTADTQDKTESGLETAEESIAAE